MAPPVAGSYLPGLGHQRPLFGALMETVKKVALMAIPVEVPVSDARQGCAEPNGSG